MRSIEVWDEERWGNKLLVLSGEPQLIAPIPSQGVDVGEEGGLLDVLLFTTTVNCAYDLGSHSYI